MTVSDRVRLITPGNDRLDGTLATVAELTDWGAHCLTPAAATGRYRAAWCEMEPLGTVGHDFVAVEAATMDQWLNSPAVFNGHVKPHQGVPPVLTTDGSCCTTCGSLNMLRAGSCLTCQDCGSNTGCG